MENPWKTINQQIAYDNPWIQVTHRNVLNPSGNPGIYGVVHFKNKAIAVVPLDEDYNTWPVGQFRYTLNEYSWEVPEGGSPLSMNPLESAKKELIEETGIRANKWIDIGKLHTSNSVTDEECLMYVAKELTFGEAQPEETEELVVKKLPFSKVVDMVINGEITDALAVSAILKINILIERGII